MTKLKLRPYQEDALAAIAHNFDTGTKAQIIVQATGLGKTEQIIRHVLDEYDISKDRILLIAQSIELVYQMHERFLKRAPELKNKTFNINGKVVPAIGMEMNSLADSSARILVATRQTLAKNDCERLRDVLDYGAFTLWVIDEADLSITAEHDALHDLLEASNPDLRVLGVTATTERSDNRALGLRFEQIAYQVPIYNAIKLGWLKDIDPIQVNAVLPDVGSKSITPAMFSNWAEVKYQTWIDLDGPNRYTVDFLPGRQASRDFCRFMQEKGVPTIHVDSELCIDLDGRTHRNTKMSYAEHREHTLSQLRESARYACNNDVLSRGFDMRKWDMVVLTSATASSSTFTQRVGRGTRLPPGIFKLMQQLDGTWYIEYEDGTVATLHEDELDFNPRLLLVDFTRSSTTLQGLASLVGTEKKPRQHTPSTDKEEEESEDDATTVDTRDIALELKQRTRKIWRKSSGNWYTDLRGAMSCSFSQDAPYALFITPPNKQAARIVWSKLFGDTLSTKPTLTNEQFHRYTSLNNILDNFVLWQVEGQKNDKGYIYWDTAIPASLLHENIKDNFVDVNNAQTHAEWLLMYLVEESRKKGYQINLAQQRRYRYDRNLPSEKQLGFLEKQVKSIQNSKYKIWPDAQCATPETLNEASLAISHFILMRPVYSEIQKLWQGEKVLYYDPHSLGRGL